MFFTAFALLVTLFCVCWLLSPFASTHLPKDLSLAMRVFFSFFAIAFGNLPFVLMIAPASTSSAAGGLIDKLNAIINTIERDMLRLKRHYETPQYQKDQTPDQWHPLVRTHPYLDRKALYLSPSHITGIGDLSFEDSEAELARLQDWASQDRFVYKHRWQQNDVVIWDNSSVMHRRDGFPPEQCRFMKRTGFHLPAERGVPF